MFFNKEGKRGRKGESIDLWLLTFCVFERRKKREGERERGKK
jgi:hypothetical protein